MNRLFGLLIVLTWTLTFTSCSSNSFEEDLEYTQSTTGNEKITVDPVAMEDALLDLINEHRLSMGLNALENSTTSYKYAEEHNDYMISKNSLSHDNFDERAQKIASEMSAVSISENVARYYSSAETTMEAWLESATHRTAMEGDFTHTTLSVQLDKDGRPYYTEIFIKVE
ncbi:CAP domain-containing protein [Flagellimonas zhangzhouensis]|uniref:Cysteine-rich secretory protein family protein n=1 Tax=Flagellimonas zhangzhouensis TaxID=1073328 RepID=A0A1H2V4A7_9FLAO|nr:CAP domain-containing protein [Allomuricauda zhangzhouensis]SDQ10999.1 Cysteine-rich secretory protein family protein [Allomuricauda zhangzhouensis]SDW63133.1 Cysteine-rich secretory protein family protein [Allomuricauda zhangzhouensis]